MRLLSRAFWQAAGPRAERSAAQGFLVGCGLGSYAGDFAVLSWQAVGHGVGGALSMAVLSIVLAVAAQPPEENP